MPILIGISQPSKKKPSNSVSNFGSEKKPSPYIDHKRKLRYFPKPNHHSWICIFSGSVDCGTSREKQNKNIFPPRFPYDLFKTLYMLLILLRIFFSSYVFFKPTQNNRQQKQHYTTTPTPPNTKKRDKSHHFVTPTPNKPLCFLLFLHQDKTKTKTGKTREKPKPSRTQGTSFNG